MTYKALGDTLARLNYGCDIFEEVSRVKKLQFEASPFEKELANYFKAIKKVTDWGPHKVQPGGAYVLLAENQAKHWVDDKSKQKYLESIDLCKPAHNPMDCQDIPYKFVKVRIDTLLDFAEVVKGDKNELLYLVRLESTWCKKHGITEGQVAVRCENLIFCPVARHWINLRMRKVGSATERESPAATRSRAGASVKAENQFGRWLHLKPERIGVWKRLPKVNNYAAVIKSKPEDLGVEGVLADAVSHALLNKHDAEAKQRLDDAFD